MSNFFTTNQAATKWLESYVTKCPDSLSTTKLGQFWASDAKFQFANMPEVKGLDNVEPFIAGSFEQMQWSKHDVLQLDMTLTKLLVSMNVTYVLKGDPEKKGIVIPAFNVLELRGVEGEGVRIAKLQVWADTKPVMDRGMELQKMAAGSA